MRIHEKAFDDVFYLFGYAGDRGAGWQLVPPRSSVEIRLPASGSPAGTLLVRPNYLMVVVDVISTLLSVLPATAGGGPGPAGDQAADGIAGIGDRRRVHSRGSGDGPA